MAVVGLLIALVLLQGSDGGEDGKCPPWHFTPTNATSPCSGCSLPAVADVYCTETSGVIDVTFVMSTRSGSLFLGEVRFELDRTKWLLHGNPVFSELPPNVSELEGFFCNGSDRRGFLCGRCKPGCGISIYTYYGLPCACPCYSYGIPLYILLEIGFSTLFFLVLVVCSFSANSSKWITVVLYFELIAHLISSDSSIYTILAKETRRCLHQDTNSFITPSLNLCSALKFRLFVVNALGKEKTSSHRINYMKYIIDLKEAKM